MKNLIVVKLNGKKEELAEEAEGIVYKPKPAASESSEGSENNEGGEVEEEDDMSW